jgi:alpha-L-rhamnosidase
MHRVTGALLIVAAIAATAPLYAQVDLDPIAPSRISNELLDPARDLQRAPMESALHQPLPEQYIWTREGTEASEPHYNAAPNDQSSQKPRPRFFRRIFHVSSLPAQATLYVAVPGQATIYLNGEGVGHYQLNLGSQLGLRVYELDVTSRLHTGTNVLAIEALPGTAPFTEAEDAVSRHLRDGKILAAMILPAARGIRARPLVMSDAEWKAAALAPPAGWQALEFNDTAWPRAEDLGGIESSVDLFQGNSDGGMYAWPGYDGISPYLAHFSLQPIGVLHAYDGAGAIRNAQAVVAKPGSGELTVDLPSQHVSGEDAPQMVLDFGREVTGRIALDSDSDAPAEVTVQYGESEAETELQPYLGTNPVYLPAHQTAYGPKSAFRYALIRFTGGRSTRFRGIHLDGIAYPVEYRGSFESSDPKLNRIWWVGAYTAHLCMEDGIWDAPKRDRNRWMGDLDVSGRTIGAVFGDDFLMQDTLERLLGPAPVAGHVNGIAGYSAFWVTGEKEYYLRTGSLTQLRGVHTRLVQLLLYMEKDLDQRDLFANRTAAWPFVDWAPDMNGDTPQARMGTHFEYYAAFRDGAYLLRVLHDEKNAGAMQAEADALKNAAQKYLRDSRGTFGDHWQTNAYAVLSGVADESQYAAIWRDVLSQVGKRKYATTIITPYYGFYVASAMAELGHRQAALDWIRQYWGGMVDEGATSFWEGYNTTWFKDSMFHASLQADNISGFMVSLAHGWSSGATPWLMTQVLGIRPTAGGFAKVDVRPDLVDLEWARGAEPTPHGLLQVAIRNDKGYTTTIGLPQGVVARVSVPVPSPDAGVTVNGRRVASVGAEGGKRAMVILSGQGTYVVTSR